MLAYTPVHHLLLRAFGAPLVMTSGNVSHEPIAYEDSDALERLSAVADAFLTHNRPIRTRCDDSVVRSVQGSPVVLRRSRGAAPRPLLLGAELSRPILALGGQSAVTFALGRGQQAFVSHYLGDLEHYAAYRAYLDAIEHFQRLFAIEPAVVVHDLHPDYASTVLARELAAERGIERVAVQHHHAHIAATMLEHGLDERVIGVAFDGTGYGTDGSIWGGEFLFCDRLHFERRAHFRPLPLPGAERAVLEPWRIALSCLVDAGEPLDLLPSRTPNELRAVGKLLESGAFSPRSSGVGRLFDAVSALCGLCSHSTYDGQAAIELEWAAHGALTDSAYDFEFEFAANDTPHVVDTRPLVRGVARDLRGGATPAAVSRRFHRTVARIVVDTCERMRAETGHAKVVLGGGVFANAILIRELEETLPARGFELFRPRAYPPGDGGLCLGQLAVAAARDASCRAGA
jgi:hydrogenase maturation protein HypF